MEGKMQQATKQLEENDRQIREFETNLEEMEKQNTDLTNQLNAYVLFTS